MRQRVLRFLDRRYFREQWRRMEAFERGSVLTTPVVGFFLDRIFLFARGRLLAWSPEEGR